jgi:hypothetical protein
LRIVIVMGNLEYKNRLIYEGLVDRSALRVVYAVIVISSLLLWSHFRVRLFGVLMPR